MKIEKLETKYKYKFSPFFKRLWNDGMLDWMNGRKQPFSNNETWESVIYPTIKEKPPLLLHSGGLDFELLTPDSIYDYKFDELWDIENHHFIPFAKMKDEAVYAFYPQIKTNGESAVVCIWNDMNETEVIAKNFEDFIFRMMLESVYDIDKEDLAVDYKQSQFEGYREDLLKDLKSVSSYLNHEYVKVLTEVYNRETIIKGMLSYGLIEHGELINLIDKYLMFDELNSVFEHEVD